MSDRQDRRSSGVGPFGAIRERPMLFVAMSALTFAVMLSALWALLAPPHLGARLRTNLIELDSTASDPSTLIRPAPLTAARLRAAIGGGADNVQAAAAATAAEAPLMPDLIRMEAADGNGAVITELGWDAGPEIIAEVTDQLAAFVDRLNAERAEQRMNALAWLERRGAAWQAGIDEAKAAILQSPFNPDTSWTKNPAKSEQLLRMMIRATVEAKTTAENGDAGSASSGRPDAATELASDAARMATVLADLQAGQDAQLEHGKALKEAEAALANHRQQAAILMSEGSLLSRPAARVLEPPAVKAQNWIQQLQAAGWQALLPILTLLSLITATVGTFVVCRIWPGPGEERNDDYLNDPNWPLPPGAHRDLSD